MTITLKEYEEIDGAAVDRIRDRIRRLLKQIKIAKGNDHIGVCYVTYGDRAVAENVEFPIDNKIVEAALRNELAKEAEELAKHGITVE